ASYPAALAMAAPLAAAVGHDDETAHQLDAIPDLLATLLGQEAWEDLATRFGGPRRPWAAGGAPPPPLRPPSALLAGRRRPQCGHRLRGRAQAGGGGVDARDRAELRAVPARSVGRGGAGRRRRARRAAGTVARPLRRRGPRGGRDRRRPRGPGGRGRPRDRATGGGDDRAAGGGGGGLNRRGERPPAASHPPSGRG